MTPRPRPPQFGLIVLQADETLEDDMRRLMPEDASCLVSRVPSGQSLTRETIREMENHLTAAAALLPCGARFQGVAYGCTSGTAEIGAPRIATLIRAGVETPVVTEPVSALIAACQHLGITSIGLVSPYVASVSAQLIAALDAAGIKTAHAISFDEPLEENVARISAEQVTEAATRIADTSDCDAVFLSCTNLQTLDLIAPLEARIGKPVLSSNQVLAWHLCRRARLAHRHDAPGALFTT